MPHNYDNLDEHLKVIHEAMRDYQRKATAEMKSRPKGILDGDMGSGKSLIGLTTVMIARPQRVLILCSKNALYTWDKEIKKWFTPWHDYVIVRGSKTQRPKIWKTQHLFKACTFGTFKEDLEAISNCYWDYIIVDEYHKSGMRNKATAMWEMFKAFVQARTFTKKNKKTKRPEYQVFFDKNVDKVIKLSGTCISRGPVDLWGPMNILAPRMFPSFWKFLNAFTIRIDGPFGTEYKGVKNADGLRDIIRPYYYRIPRSVTNEQLPPRQRIPIDIDPTPKQLKYYKTLVEESMIDTGDNLILASTTLARDTRLRQLLACPRVLGIDDDGAGIEAIWDMMTDAPSLHGVIFTQFKSAIPFWEEFLEKKMTKENRVPIDYLWGGMSPEEIKEKTERFREKRGIMICSIKFAQSFELETAKRGWFLGFDFDPNENEQAEGRIRRASSTMDPISFYYVKHRIPDYDESIEDRLMEILATKSKDRKNTLAPTEALSEQQLKEYRERHKNSS